MESQALKKRFLFVFLLRGEEKRDPVGCFDPEILGLQVRPKVHIHSSYSNARHDSSDKVNIERLKKCAMEKHIMPSWIPQFASYQ